MASKNESTKLPFNGENRGKSRKGVKKIPQRGVGVEKLEKMRIQESLKTFHHQQQQLLLSYGRFQIPQQQQQVINNNNNMNNVVVGSGFSPFVGNNKNGFGVGASSSSWKELSSIPNLNHHHHHHQSLEQQQQQLQVMNNNNKSRNNVVGNKSGFGVGASSSSSNGYGWFGRNPFENSSKELSSIPNLNHQSLDLCLKKSRLNEENIMMKGANYPKREMALENWNPHHVHHGFLGFMPQPKSSVSAYYPTQNHDECVEVVAVHRKGNSSYGSGRVFMEYEFFPEKDYGKSTTTIPKDFFPTATSGEASSSITATTSYGDHTSMAYDSIDLSLRL